VLLGFFAPYLYVQDELAGSWSWGVWVFALGFPFFFFSVLVLGGGGGVLGGGGGGGGGGFGFCFFFWLGFFGFLPFFSGIMPIGNRRGCDVLLSAVDALKPWAPCPSPFWLLFFQPVNIILTSSR